MKLVVPQPASHSENFSFNIYRAIHPTGFVTLENPIFRDRNLLLDSHWCALPWGRFSFFPCLSLSYKSLVQVRLRPCPLNPNYFTKIKLCPDRIPMKCNNVFDDSITL